MMINVNVILMKTRYIYGYHLDFIYFSYAGVCRFYSYLHSRWHGSFGVCLAHL